MHSLNAETDTKNFLVHISRSQMHHVLLMDFHFFLIRLTFMATTSLASSSMQGLATCSKFCIQNEWNCQKRRKSQASTSVAFFSPFHQVQHSQCGWHMGVCMKSRFLALKAIDEDDRPPEDDSEEESSSDDNSEQVCIYSTYSRMLLL